MTLKPSTFPLFSSSNPQAFDLIQAKEGGGGDRLWHLFLNFFFELFYVFFADVYRNEGNEAFKEGDFIAIHFYTKGIYILSLPLKYKEVTSYPRYQRASQVFPKIIVMVVGLQHVWLIRDIYFNNRKSPGFTKGCRSSHWVKSNFP